MEAAILFFLSSGLFLGWALGGNHLGNVFGTAIGTQMVSWRTAAILGSVFVILGAVISGAGPTETLGKLGAINTLGGSFMAALAAGLTVYWMTNLGLPVSTTQAIVGAILGWNFFTETQTDYTTLRHILTGWVAGPILSAVFAILLYLLLVMILRRAKLHLLRSDAYTRLGLIVAGIFGAYSLGANNIANVMGVFVASVPLADLSVSGIFTLNGKQQLFLMGGIAIAVGIFTYSHKVVETLGSGLLSMSPVAAWVVVMAHSLVLLMFASERLRDFLLAHGLPALPLVPISSAEAIVGAVLGIGLLQGGRGVRWHVLGHISLGWLLTPIISGIVCFFGLFFMQNVFDQTVH
ncbi:MAG: anion permease [Rhodospirillales bacterium]